MGHVQSDEDASEPELELYHLLQQDLLLMEPTKAKGHSGGMAETFQDNLRFALKL